VLILSTFKNNRQILRIHPKYDNGIVTPKIKNFSIQEQGFYPLYTKIKSNNTELLNIKKHVNETVLELS